MIQILVNMKNGNTHDIADVKREAFHWIFRQFKRDSSSLEERKPKVDGLAATLLVDLHRAPIVVFWRRRREASALNTTDTLPLAPSPPGLQLTRFLLAPPSHQPHKWTDLLSFQNKELGKWLRVTVWLEAGQQNIQDTWKWAQSDHKRKVGQFIGVLKVLINQYLRETNEINRRRVLPSVITSSSFLSSLPLSTSSITVSIFSLLFGSKRLKWFHPFIRHQRNNPIGVARPWRIDPWASLSSSPVTCKQEFIKVHCCKWPMKNSPNESRCSA